MYQWLVVGISGVTCGGKTTLTHRLKELLIHHFQLKKQKINVVVISQDHYFLKLEDPRHVLLPSLGHFNWELPTAVDLNGMYESACKILASSAEMKEEQEALTEVSKTSYSKGLLHGILLIEGFLVLNHRPTSTLCHLGYYILLSRAACHARRVLRTYDPPDIPGYFEQCVWPEHVSRRAEILGKGKLIDDSDPLTMAEVAECVTDETSSSEDCFEKKYSDYSKSTSVTTKNSPNQTSVVDVSTLGETPQQCSETLLQPRFYMKTGGNITTLPEFGDAGLGTVHNIRVLNGGAVDSETLAKLVVKDVLNEIERHKYESAFK